MRKVTFFTGQPIFNQILSLIPRAGVSSLVKKYNADRYCKKFKSFDHLVTMLYCCFHHCNSLRELITGMQASSARLAHLGLKFTPRRSTLADANERRTADLFQDLYHLIYKHFYSGLPDSVSKKKVENKLYIIDSTIISLFSTVMQSTGSFGLNGKKKGGVKANVVVRAAHNLPCFVRLSEGKRSDKKFLSEVNVPKGSIVVMDKGYNSYEQFLRWTLAGITWVTRMNNAAVYSIVATRRISEKQAQYGVRADDEINLGNPRTVSKIPLQKARLIIFYDAASGKEFQFITNNFTYGASTIADIYKKRWQIEMIFKRVKQNFQLHYFLGDNENAIRIQLWCTLIADLLIKVIKDKADKKRSWSMANLTGLVRLHLGTYIALFKFLAAPEKALINYIDPIDKMQLQMFPEQTRGA